MPHTPENGYNQAMTEAELRKIAEYVDEIVHGLHEWDYRRPVGNPFPKKPHHIDSNARRRPASYD